MQDHKKQWVETDRYQTRFDARYFVDLAGHLCGDGPRTPGRDQEVIAALAGVIRQRQQILEDLVSSINAELRTAVTRLNRAMETSESKLLVDTLEEHVNGLLQKRAKAKMSAFADIWRCTKDLMFLSKEVPVPGNL